MAAIRTTRQLDRDLKRSSKRGKHLEKLWRVVETLAKGERLAPRHRPHKLSGDWADF
jgi:mRNA interferase YafQ